MKQNSIFAAKAKHRVSSTQKVLGFLLKTEGCLETYRMVLVGRDL